MENFGSWGGNEKFQNLGEGGNGLRVSKQFRELPNV